MMTIRSRSLFGWKIALMEDARRNRYIEIFDEDDAFVVSLSPTKKIYHFFEKLLAQSPVIPDEELAKLYEMSTDGISHKYGRTLAYARAVIELSWQTLRSK